MAADATLSVAVVAEIEGFKSGFNQVGVSIGDLQRKILAYKDIVANSLDTKVIAKYNAMIEVTSTELNRLNSIGKKGFDSVGNAVLASGAKIAKGSNQAGMALTDLGRIAQDAPFGFIGIQNNINPLVESFQRLKTETGSTGGALKALGSSLIGPAGLGLAFSLVSAGILLYQQYQQKANKITSDAKKTTDDYVDSLNQVTGARLKGTQSAQDELINLQLLFKAYQNGNLPLKTRKEAYDQIQQQYPDYFKNIKFETEASDKTTTAYNNLTTAILATARARAAQDLITKNSTRQLEDEQKIVDLTTAKIKAQKELNDAIKSEQSTRGQVQGNSFSQTGNILEQQIVINKRKALGEIDEQINNLYTDRNVLTDRNLQLEKSVTKELEKGGKLTGSVGNSTTTPTKKGSNAKEIARLKAEKSDLLFLINETAKGIKTADLDIETSLGKMADIQIPTFKPGLTPIEILTNKLLEDTITFDDVIKDLGSSIVDNLGGFFESLGEAMSSGDFSNFGQDILQAFEGFLGQLGQLMIKQGTSQIAFGIAKNLIPPGGLGAADIAAGIGMTAAGAAISLGSGLLNGAGQRKSGSSGASYKSIPQFATGVTNFSGGLAIVGEQGPELLNLPAGSDVIPNHRIASMGGGDTPINLVATVGVKMGELYVDLQREGKKRGRTI